MTRVWNVTNNPSTDVKSQNLLVLGKVLQPGQSVQVDEEQLKLAHKIHAAVEAKLLYVGKDAPGYLARATRATLPVGMARSHGAGVPPPVAPVSALAAESKVVAKEPSAEEEKPSEDTPHMSGKRRR
jgi:hypothetical protein